jgi:glycerate-2-kinase
MCPGRVVTLVVSDVPGDDVAVVGSGPTVPGKDGDVVRLVAGMETLRRAAATRMGGLGTRVEERPEVIAGTVEEVMRDVVGVAQRIEEGCAWVAGGEWTVAVTGNGRGGRATHLALMLARELAGVLAGRVLVAGSDGIDGTGPWAGAVVDGATWARVAGEGERGLRACDSGTVLAAVGATITSGPTGVNHADLVIVVRPET